MTENEKSLILIVDDDLINIDILKAVLNHEYNIVIAMRGQQALELAKKHHPDLILLDVIMPRMSGYQVCEQLKADEVTTNIPIIFITSLNDTQAEIKGLQAGAIDYVTKPINPPILQMRVRNHIELQKARKILKHLSITDGLTDLANRRHFDEVLQNELNRQSRLNHPLSLIMLDVDCFKNFNDSYGHVQGDICLKQIAHTIRGCLHRMSDFVARYGGEEFACILSNTNQKNAVIMAERVRYAIENLNIPHCSSHVSEFVTVSVGVLTVLSTHSKADANEIITLADKQLYLAKEKGRNQIFFDKLPANAD